MKVTVVIPIGPGHGHCYPRAVTSVHAAWLESSGPFREMHVHTIHDPEGRLGRSAARNQGMDASPSDFHFLLDADDSMLPNAFAFVDLNACATFGSVFLRGRPYRRNRWPVTRETLIRHGADGTLSMGCFVRGDLGLRFDESLDAGEDFDFYMRLPDFVKLPVPLVEIGYDEPSAGGPRGYESLDWRAACAEVVARYA